jgi:hypothetical protein
MPEFDDFYLDLLTDVQYVTLVYCAGNGMEPHAPARSADTPGAAWRQVVLLVYVAGVVSIVIAIACLIFLFT